MDQHPLSHRERDQEVTRTIDAESSRLQLMQASNSVDGQLRITRPERRRIVAPNTAEESPRNRRTIAVSERSGIVLGDSGTDVLSRKDKENDDDYPGLSPEKTDRPKR